MDMSMGRSQQRQEPFDRVALWGGFSAPTDLAMTVELFPQDAAATAGTHENDPQSFSQKPCGEIQHVSSRPTAGAVARKQEDGSSVGPPRTESQPPGAPALADPAGGFGGLPMNQCGPSFSLK
jgi:hypothetical protein